MPTEPRLNEPMPFGSTAAEPTADDRTDRDHRAEPQGRNSGSVETSGAEGPDTSTTGPADTSGSGSSGERDADPDEDRVATLERRVSELEAELDAVRGLLGGVEAIDEAVERRAAAALAKAEALEERIAPAETGLVRERLPEAEDGCRGAVGDDLTDRPRDDRPGRRDGGCHDVGPTRDGRTGGSGSRAQDGRTSDGGGCGGAVDRSGAEDRTSAPTSGGVRRHPDDAATSDGGPGEAGAISSVGAGGADDDVAARDTEASDRSLAERLRDAFR